MYVTDRKDVKDTSTRGKLPIIPCHWSPWSQGALLPSSTLHYPLQTETWFPLAGSMIDKAPTWFSRGEEITDAL